MKKSTPRPSSRQNRVFQLVRRGHRIYHQIAQLSAQLKPIEEMLRTEALKQPFEHILPEDGSADRAEWSARARSVECRVVLPGPQLVELFAENHPELPTIRRMCGARFGQLFTESLHVRITDTTTFRQQVAHLFTPEQGAQLLRHCAVIAESVVVWTPPPSTKGKPAQRRTLP